MVEMAVDVEIARPRNEVLAWWHGFTDDYVAKDPREQPFRIQVKARTAERVELLSWFKVFGVTLKVPQTMLLRPDGNFAMEVALPFGMAQKDEFRFEERGGKTHVHIGIEIWGTHAAARAMVPAYMAVYARPRIPKNFRMAGRLCEQNAPRLGTDQVK